MALDRRNYKQLGMSEASTSQSPQPTSTNMRSCHLSLSLSVLSLVNLVETTVELANKVGGAEIITKIVEDLKDESEPYRKMVMEAIEKVVENLGVSDIDAQLEELLVDGILYAFQEQTSDDTIVMLNGV
jgi:hypothetical protein